VRIRVKSLKVTGTTYVNYVPGVTNLFLTDFLSLGTRKHVKAKFVVEDISLSL
jgi:hypothetical protein